LKLNIIADENIDSRIFSDFIINNSNLIDIASRYSGFSDFDIINLAEQNNAIIVTEDKDFGEWVFSHHKIIGVILLRYKYHDIESIKKTLHNVIEKYGSELREHFTVLSPKKIRIRKI